MDKYDEKYKPCPRCGSNRLGIIDTYDSVQCKDCDFGPLARRFWQAPRGEVSLPRYACPKCGECTPLEVTTQVENTLIQGDGRLELEEQPDAGRHWGPESPMMCWECGHKSLAKDFDKEPPRIVFTIEEQSEILRVDLEDQAPHSLEGMFMTEPSGQPTIAIEGFSNCNQDEGSIIALDLWEGELRLLVWADINQEDPTHTISLEAARQTNRRDDGDS